MILNGPDSSLALEILGYEFRQPCGETYDDNWLSVRISVRHPRGNWTSVDPSLQTTEAAALAEWLAAIGTEAEVAVGPTFIEPNLAFRISGEEPGNRSLRVYFELESRPNWAPSTFGPVEDLWIDVSLEEQQLQAAAASLRAALKQFPFREG